jgi:hypothetical protein
MLQPFSVIRLVTIDPRWTSNALYQKLKEILAFFGLLFWKKFKAGEKVPKTLSGVSDQMSSVHLQLYNFIQHLNAIGSLCEEKSVQLLWSNLILEERRKAQTAEFFSLRTYLGCFERHCSLWSRRRSCYVRQLLRTTWREQQSVVESKCS